MAIKQRQYTGEPGFTEDFHRVRDFLVRIDDGMSLPFDWVRWEWNFSLSFHDKENLSKIGIWEDDGRIVAIATYEDQLGYAYFMFDKEYSFLKEEMLIYAKSSLHKDGQLKLVIADCDREFQRIAARHGFKATRDKENNAVFDIDVDKISYTLPEGYTITSLADSYDLYKYNKVLWRGFNHEGEPPTTEEQIERRRISLSGPHLDLNLCVAVVAPNGDFASYCGMWYDRSTDFALVEPVATDPDYRKMGLAKAAVLEGIKRCGLLGAKQAYVGSSQQFYYQIGFSPIPAYTYWE
ncbi:MAG: GNAT family N-acetyltransferase [Bacillota bacterium]